MDITVSSAETFREQEYRLADIAVYPVGEKQALVHTKDTDAACFLHRTYIDLLRQCHEFKTLDKHLATFFQERQVDDERIRQGLRYKLQHLAQEGYLISREQIRALFQRTNESSTPTRITSLCIATCDRVEALQRGLISYLEHCQHFGRTLDFVVTDDSQSLSTRETYRQMLRTLKERYSVNIAYAGIEEKTTFVKKLSKAGSIPEEIVAWACVPSKEYGVGTLGANRNAFLLHTAGECIFNSDDDITCRVAASPGYKEGLTLRSQANLQWRSYPDRQSALDATRPMEQDFFTLHEHWLGQDPKVAGAPYQRDGLIEYEQADPDFLRRLATRPGKILVTAHGMVGDNCCQTKDTLLFSKQLISSEEAYLSAQTSREVAQGANQVTLTRDSYSLIGMCIGGLDNRELLPPFGPVGRGDDTLFGCILKCFPDAYTVYLPWVLLHSPLEARSYSEPIFTISIDRLLIRCIDLFNLALPGKYVTTERLSQLSQFLEHIGRLPAPSFEMFTRHSWWQLQGTILSLLDKQTREQEKSCSVSWKRDAEAYYAQAQQSMLLPVKHRVPGGPEMAQRAILQFAQILKWWPTMVETARHLRADGCRLAQPV